MNRASRSPESGSIKFLTGPLTGRVFSITKPTITIGRDTSNDIVIKDDPHVSPYHVRLFWKNIAWHIEKLPQASEVSVNQQNVDYAMLSERSLIGLGQDTSFLFLISAQQQDTHDSNAGGEGTQPLSLDDPATQPAILLDLVHQASTKQLVRPISQRPDQTEIAPLSVLGIASLEVSSNTSDNRKVYPLDKKIINIGRDATNDIVINDLCVSGFHAQIVREGNQLVLVHPHPKREQTVNGMLYHGRKIRGDEHFRKILASGDVFRIGNESGSFVTLTYHDGRTEQPEELPPVHPIRLTDDELTIGRLPDNTVVLAHPQVSAHHARLIREGGSYRIFDLNSTNHVYVVSSRFFGEGEKNHHLVEAVLL